MSSVEVLQHNFETIKPDSIFTSIIFCNLSLLKSILLIEPSKHNKKK